MITKIGMLAAAALTTAMSAPAHAWGFHGGVVRGGYGRPVGGPAFVGPRIAVGPRFGGAYVAPSYGYGYGASYGYAPAYGPAYVAPTYVGWQRPYYGAGYGYRSYGGGYGHWGHGWRR